MLEFDKLEPIIEKNDLLYDEYLVEDFPGHYVSAKDSVYGVYDYDTGEPLPDGYKTVRRYTKGKFLIIMKSGYYNEINSTYDVRHVLPSNSEFRYYIDRLHNIIDCLKQNDKFKNLDYYEKENVIRNILNKDLSQNPFSK